MDEPNRPRRPNKINTNNPDFSDHIRELLMEEGLDDPNSDTSVDDSDTDTDFVLPLEETRQNENPDDDSEESEAEEGEEEEDLEGNAQQCVIDNLLPQNGEEHFYLERMKKKEIGPPNAWSSKEPTRNVRTPARNIIRTLPGIRGRARTLGNKPDKTDVWQLFFDLTMVNSIVHNTNVKLASVRAGLSNQTKKNNYRDTDIDEINALIGLELLSSILRSNDERINSLFTKDCFSRPIFSATMSEKRFEILLMCLRFDDVTTRPVRRQTDKAAPISELFDQFIANSRSIYSPSSNVTIDEMLVPFRGRCSFRVFMPNKPRKYGIKVMCLCDSKTSYLINAYIYTGRGSDATSLSEQEKTLSIPCQAVIKLCKPIVSTNRNITADNWFSCEEVLDELLKRNLTYVGTVKKNKKFIPREFLPDASRTEKSSIYGFRDKTTLLSFVPKKNRAVVLASTMHSSIETDEEKQKPEIICYYNRTKAGVDLLDMKCAVFSSSRRTRRWPLAIFYRILNIASVNTFIAYMSYKETPMMTRFDFVKQLAYDLIVPHLKRRLANPSLQRGLKESIRSVLGENVEEPREQAEAADLDEAGPSDRLEKRKTCSKCPSVKKRKTAYKCIVCNQPICLECSRKVCVRCAVEDVMKN